MMATSVVRNARSAPVQAAAKALRASGALWFTIALAGQAGFAAYVASFYGRTALAQRFDRWNEVLVGGYVRGGVVGNVVLAIHLALAVVITVGGPLQLLAPLRRRAPALHRWNGRVYAATAFVTTLAGAYATWTRGTVGDVSMRLGVTFDGVLILIATALAVREARARRMASHRRWALRAFVVVSGVWFFRVGFMLWVLAMGGPVGVGDGFDGPFVRVWSFACYLLPLAILELYLWAERHPRATPKALAAAVLGCAAAGTAIGIFGALMAMWLPKM